MQSIENKILKRIQGKGKGWAYCQKDFLAILSQECFTWELEVKFFHRNKASTC